MNAIGWKVKNIFTWFNKGKTENISLNEDINSDSSHRSADIEDQVPTFQSLLITP